APLRLQRKNRPLSRGRFSFGTPTLAASTHALELGARLAHDPLMRELPGGTVTFVFTDIEGSTRLLRELDADYADALVQHRRVVREAFGRRGGIEVDTQGDAFFF